MIKHIVLFQLKDEVGVAEKQHVMQAFKKGILALPDTISCIRHIEVGFNANAEESYEIALYSVFDSLADVKAYAVHPDHLAVAQIIRPYVKSRACTDYEI